MTKIVKSNMSIDEPLEERELEKRLGRSIVSKTNFKKLNYQKKIK